MAHTSRCAHAAGPLSKCRCSCGGNLHGGSGTQAHTARTAQTRLTVTDNPDAARLRTGLASGLTGTRPLGGDSGCHAEEVTCTDGTVVVRKDPDTAYDNDSPDDPDRIRDANILATVVITACGLRAPEVVIDDDGRVVMERLDGPRPALTDGWCRDIHRELDAAGSDDIWALALADTLQSLRDRNCANFGWNPQDPADGTITGTWDHDDAFQWEGQDPHSAPSGAVANGPAGLLADFDGMWRSDIQLTAADVARVRRRLKAERWRFKAPTLRRNRDGWYRNLMARLNAIEPHCQGARNRIR